MDIESIRSIWESWQEVQEKKALDPVNDVANDKKFKDRKDKDIDNDGDVDSSDEFLHKKRAATDDAIDGGKRKAESTFARKEVDSEIQKGTGKEPANEPGENPPKVSKAKQVKVAYEEKGVNPFDKKNIEDEDEMKDDEKKSGKPKKGVNPFSKKAVKDDEEMKDAENDQRKDAKESSEQPRWLQALGEKLRAMEESDDPVADEEEAYKDDKKEGGNRKATSTNRKSVDKEIQKGYGKQPANEPGQDDPNSKKSPSKEKQIATAYEAFEDEDELNGADARAARADRRKKEKGDDKIDQELEDDYDNDFEDDNEGDEEDAARIKKRAVRNSDVNDNGEPTKEKMKGMRKEDFASEADWRVSSMREALAVMEKQQSGLNQSPQAKNQSKMATSSEPMLDVLTSVGEAEFVLRQKQSNPELEDMEDNKAALPTGVNKEAPSRRGTDNLNNGDGKKPRSPKNQ